MVIVGLNEENDSVLRLFKEILTKALDNLFVIEFCDQFIPEEEKLPNNQVSYRNHEVKESWMYKMRQERPAILIDFRLISMYIHNDDDSILAEQIIQTKSSLPVDGPIYLVWLAGKGIPSQRITSIMKNSRMDKSTLSVIELWEDATMITTTLKQRIQECFEHSRNYYQNLSKKYKKLVGKSDQTKFIQPWMPTVYYYFKLAVIEEFRGDFQSSLKYYHTILAKFKELIEGTRENVEERFQMINYLRSCADICFIRLSFLLFRLDQCGEAEFGLFRYLNYFSHGLSHNDQLMWRYNMSRGFARQLIKSSIWSSKNDLLMRGPAHFLIYSLKTISNYSGGGGEAYQVQEMKMRDLGDALDSALKNPQLGHFVDYLQYLILEEYFSQSLLEESGAFSEYLKNSSKFQGWPLIKRDILKKSIILAKNQQNYQVAVADEWILGKFEDENSFEDLCLVHAQIYQEPIRLIGSDFINCNVKFLKKRCEIFAECEIELSIYVLKRIRIDFYIESIGIFFDNEQIEPITFILNDRFLSFGKTLTLRKNFNPSKIGRLKISFVTMQLKKPFLALQFDDTCFYHQQNSDKFSLESLEFVRICQRTLKSNLTLRVEALRPKIKVDFMTREEGIHLAYTDIPVALTISNLLEHAIITNFTFDGKKYEIHLGPKEIQTLSLRYKLKNAPVKIKILTKTRFNLELMDLKYTELCSFDPVEEEFNSDATIQPINPFKLTRKGSDTVEIRAYHPMEWITFNGSTSFMMNRGDSKTFTLSMIQDSKFLKGSFRLLEDSIKENCNEGQKGEFLPLTAYCSIKMELSSKLKAMKFMKRKDEAEERKQVEKETQKSVERTHWTLENEGPSANETERKPKFIIEYDNTGGISGSAVGRQSFKNFNKEPESTSVNNTGSNGPVSKIPKLSDNKTKR